jgi:RimJ/RimL family protein N-acetyltransferase
LIETERLILRRWRAGDLALYAAMMADPEVTYWLGGGQSEAEAKAHVVRMESMFESEGFGIWALERKADGAFLGSAGLAVIREDIPLAPAIEVGWRLARDAWGHGYATEAARAAIDDGFARLGLAEIVTFTAASNLRSQAVMERLGLERDPTRDFDHPKLAPGHPLRGHVVYAVRARAAASAAPRRMASGSGGPEGASQLPPTHSTEGMASQSTAEAKVTPPVGQNRT